MSVIRISETLCVQIYGFMNANSFIRIHPYAKEVSIIATRGQFRTVLTREFWQILGPQVHLLRADI